MHPVLGSHESCVHGLQSLHASTPPTQLPSQHLSSHVQAFRSSHGSAWVAYLGWQVPPMAASHE